MFSVVIVMAGSGTRLKENMNKALVKLNNKPIYMYSVEKFRKYDCEIILVVNSSDYDYVLNNSKDELVVLGSDTRGKSVYNGLKLAKYNKVLIHDAARVFTSDKILDEIICNIDSYDALYVATSLKDTIKTKSESKSLNREDYLLAQTPQAFTTKLIKQSYEKALDDNLVFTDDISVYKEYNNSSVKVVEGDDYNFKITTPFDLQISKMLVGENID